MRLHGLRFIVVMGMITAGSSFPAERRESPHAAPVYLDATHPVSERVNDLLSRMTLAEKISQLGNDSPAIERLKIPPYAWSNECLHGVAAPGFSTVFPQAIALAAAWDEPLHHEVATAIGDEVRAHHEEFVRQGNYGEHTGLTCWSPNINIFRDPRWGRGQETYGEDPFLTATLAQAFVRGLQGDDPHYLKAISTAKHYAVHSGPEPTRYQFDAETSDYDLANTYFPAFEAAIHAGANSVMCSYNALRGVPACASDFLLQKTLRDLWGFRGYVVSDCGAVGAIYSSHAYTSSITDAAAKALNAGTDLACGSEYEEITSAEQRGLVSTARIDEAVGRLLTARFRLGMFDPPSLVSYARMPFSVVDSAAHRDLARRSAQEAIVLLKNEHDILPLRKDLKSVAVIGPNGNRVDVLLGNYNGTPSKSVTLLQGIREKLGSRADVAFQPGAPLTDGIDITAVAASADLLFHEERGQRVPGLRGDYFVGTSLSGEPAFSRTDPTVDFNWDTVSPAPGFPREQFSVRWSGTLVPKQTGSYTVGATADDGFRLYLDDKLLVDDWTDQAATTRSTVVTLEAGKAYDLRLEYYQNRGLAMARLIASHEDFETPLKQAVELAKKSDVVILALGISPQIEGEDMDVHLPGFEGGDRTTIELPARQDQLLRAIMALHRPTVAVFLNGGTIAATSADELVPGIIEAWYPGEEGGAAIADVLFGDYNPAGRLPVTTYRSTAQLPPFEDYSMENRTYRYFSGTPLYPFGFGLSYTKFEYRGLSVSKTKLTPTDSIEAGVDVTNVGKVAGDEVIEVYVSHVGLSSRAPIRALRGFRRIHLDAGASQYVRFSLTPDDFAIADSPTQKKVPPGTVTLSIGGKQPGFQGHADAPTTEALTANLEIVGQ